MIETIATIFEIGMVICFGASWPFNILRAYKARTAKGTSLSFTLLIGIGYVCGIICKILLGKWNGLSILAFVFYIINLIMVTTGIIIYFRNKKLDAIREKQAQSENK